MSYEKRLCVIKQKKRGFSPDGGEISGVVYAEKWNDRLTLTPRLTGLSPVTEGRYVLVFMAEGRAVCFDFRGNEALATSFPPSIKKGFAVLLCHVRREAEGIAYGGCGEAASMEDLLKELGKKSVPTPLPPYEIPTPGSPNPTAPGVPLPGELPKETRGDEKPFRGYDDDAIAASDYYQNGGGEGETCPEKEEEEGGEHPVEDAPAPLFPRGSLTYYREVEDRLRTVFQTFPKDDALKQVFPHSDWVKTDGALLGIIYENGMPRYLCVAVKKQGDPPDEMKDICCLVPATPFGEDYYIVFHDADTGNPVLVDNS